jgi:hypothetical protein
MAILNKLHLIIKNYGSNIDITIIIQLLTYIATLYLFPSNNLINNMLAVDSCISAIRFIKTLHESEGNALINNYKLNESQETDLMMRKLKNFISSYYSAFKEKFFFTNDGKIRIIEKYFLFGLCQFISLIIQIVFWSFNSYLKIIINAILLLFSTPIFYILITCSIFFMNLLDKFINNIKKIINYVLSKITANIINKLTENTLNKNPKIDYIEILNYYEDIGSNIFITYNFIKTVIILSLLYYFKKTDNIFYSYVLDLVKKYQTSDLIINNYGNTEDKQKKILNIIQERNWQEFLKPKTINLLFELYSQANDNLDLDKDSFSIKIGIIIRNLKINFLRFMAIWSISIVYFPVALIIDIYYTYIDCKFYVKNNIMAYLIGTSILFTQNYFIGALLMVSSDFIIKPILEYIDENNIIRKYFIRNTNQLKYLGIMSSVYYLRYFGILIPIIIHYFNKNNKLTLVTSLIIILNSLSDFSIIHLINLWILISIFNNIYTIHQLDNISDNNLNSYLVDNYLFNPVMSNRFYMNNTIKVTEDSKLIKRKKNIKNSENRNNICQMINQLFYIKYQK